MKRDLKILSSFWFIAGLTTLLLNDFIFKELCNNWLSGKLSDFAGLFIFPLFWTALLPQHKNKIFWSTALLFILWKSPFSQALLDAWNELQSLKISRIVDYTDLLALLILPVAYGFESKRENIKTIRINPLLPLMISAFSFMATSKASDSTDNDKPYYHDAPLDYETEFTIRERKISFPLSKKEFIHLLDFYKVNYPFKITNDSIFFIHAWERDFLDTIPPVMKLSVGSEGSHVVLKLQSVLYDTSFVDPKYKGLHKYINPEDRETHADRFEQWFIPQFLLIKKIDSLNTAGLEAFDTQDYEKSIGTFNQAMQISPPWAITKLMFYASIGDCYLKMKNYHPAIENYYKADSLNHLYSGYDFRPQPYIGLALAYEQLNKRDSAKKYMRMAKDAREWTDRHK